MNIFKSKLLKNMSWMVMSKVFHMLISFLVGIFTARFLGPSNYGIINYVAAYVTFLSAVCSLGLDGVIVNELVKNRDKEGVIIGTAITMRMVISCVSMVAFNLIMYFTNQHDKTLIIVSILQSATVLFAAFDSIDYWYQSHLMSKITTILSFIAYSLAAVYKVLILVFGKSVEWFAFSATLDTVLLGSFLFISYFCKKGQKLRFSLKYGGKMLKQSWYFILSAVMVVLFTRTDQIMIGKMLGMEQEGLYAVVLVLCTAWGFIPTAIISSMRPSIMELKGTDEKLYLTRIRQTYAIIVWLSIFYGIFISIFSKYILLLLYGEQYIGARSALIVAVWYCMFSYAGAVKNIWMLCEGVQKYEVVFTAVGAATNIALNYVMIPIWGIMGAAVATLITQFVTNIFMPSLFPKTRANTKYFLQAICLQGIDIKKLFKKSKDLEES